ncbi:homogentisate phytyltransferase [Streptomyces mashuensis]|uniref:Homogentisate phytyltransferase n=1 Tax=Streptomyces mashuensis TaxID=33904 RepID=A0A919ECJ8_9ACTN|nr:homogentisate phytyltransferase [Streptomyces mashuensis]
MQVVFLLRFSAAYLLAGPAVSGSGVFLTAGGAWVAATAYTYLVNGVHDAPEDRVNGNGRPVSRGDLPVRDARRVARGLVGVALLLAAVSGVGWLLPLVGAHLLCGYAYSAPRIALKRSTPTAVAAVLVLGGLTFAAGWVSGGAGAGGGTVLAFGTVMTLWMGAVGALVKDLSDLRGDAAAGRRTALVVWGERRARAVCAVNPLAVALPFLLVALFRIPLLILPALFLTTGAVATAVLTLRTSSDQPRRISRLPYRAFMVTQYAACSALLLAALLR